MNAQESQDGSDLRIKFASIDKYGILTQDASEEYGILQDHLPDGWSAEETVPVNTVSGDRNRAWFLRAEGESLVAVEHETGLELLLGVGVNVASTAVTALVAWAWAQWRTARAKQILSGERQEPTLVLESVVDRFPDGRIRTSRKLEFHGLTDQSAIKNALQEWTRSPT